MSENEMPKPVDMYVAEITGRGRSTRTGRNVPRSVKMWPELVFRVEALAHNTGVTRNETINKLIEVGIDAVYERLSEKERDGLFALPKEISDKLRASIEGVQEEAA